MSSEKIKLLYIGGYSRSGSTLLLRFLGQMEGFVAVGELWDIWSRSFTENQLCGCGQPFRQCEFWQKVVAEAFGGFENVNAQAIQSLRRSVQSNHHLPFLALPALQPPGYRERLNHYASILGRLYQSIQRVSGGKVIVDSSKVAPYAFLLNQMDNLDLYVVHLVRDSRATAYSWQRKKVRPEIHWKTAYMDQYGPVRSALEWNIMNGLLHSLKYSNAKYMRIRYEELVQEPRQVLSRLLAGMGCESPPDADFLNGDHVVRLDVNHTVSGNPNRFEQGAVTIRPDVEWQEKMTKGRKRLVTALTWPLLNHYGYMNHHGSVADRGTVKRTENVQQPDKESKTQKTPLRILMVTARYLPHIGGTEIHTYEVARRLTAAGNKVTVLTTNPGSLQTTVEYSDGLQIIRVPAWPNHNDYYFAPSIYQFIQQRCWDVVHCQGYHTLVAPLAMLAAWQAKIPYFVTFHSGGHSSWLRNALRPLQRALLRPLLARAVGLIGVSQWEADFFREHLRLPDKQFTVIPNGSYLPKVENQTSQLNDETLIVSIGRLERYKGHHHVIEALPTVLKHCPGVRLRIVGSGPYEAALRQLANDLRVLDRVEIKAVAASDRDGMSALLLGSSLVILLSNYEAQSISVMEALALGRPVLVADATALHELAASKLARATPLGSTPEEVAAAVLDQLRRPLIPYNPVLPTWDACTRDVLTLYRDTLNQNLSCAS